MTDTNTAAVNAAQRSEVIVLLRRAFHAIKSDDPPYVVGDDELLSLRSDLVEFLSRIETTTGSDESPT